MNWYTAATITYIIVAIYAFVKAVIDYSNMQEELEDDGIYLGDIGPTLVYMACLWPFYFRWNARY